VASEYATRNGTKSVLNVHAQVGGVANRVKSDVRYHCTCCGVSYAGQMNNFSRTKSPLYVSNNGYMTVCKKCRDIYYDQLVEFFNNNEELAIDRMCSIFDWYINKDGFNASEKRPEGRSRLGVFLSKRMLGQNCKGSSYLDVIKDRVYSRDTAINTYYSEFVKDEDADNQYVLKIKELEKELELEKARTESQQIERERIERESKEEEEYATYSATEYKPTQKVVKFWGSGYKSDEYQSLQGYYEKLLDECGDRKPDIIKQKSMKNLCLLEYQIQNWIQSGKDVGGMVRTYNTIFESSGLKKDVDSVNNSFGEIISMIETYTPAEYYKDKTKYKDFFGIGDYIERYMFRPLKNLLTGSKVPEKEHWIGDVKDSDGGDIL